MIWQRLFATGAVLGALAIAAGAFGAHALKKRLSTDDLAIFETGARYNMYGALAVLAFSLAAAHGLRTVNAGWVLVAGTAIFAGTLYGIALGGPRWLGAITPLGGTLMLVALAWAAISAVRA